MIIESRNAARARRYKGKRAMPFAAAVIAYRIRSAKPLLRPWQMSCGMAS